MTERTLETLAALARRTGLQDLSTVESAGRAAELAEVALTFWARAEPTAWGYRAACWSYRDEALALAEAFA